MEAHGETSVSVKYNDTTCTRECIRATTDGRYRRLMVRGGFKLPSAVKIATSRWLQHANPLPAFIEACCVEHPEAECRLS
jgi:hypothetical protein